MEPSLLAPSTREPGHLSAAQPQRFLLLAKLPAWKGLSQGWGSAVTGRGSRRDSCIWDGKLRESVCCAHCLTSQTRLGNPSTVLLPFSNSITKNLGRILIPTSALTFLLCRGLSGLASSRFRHFLESFSTSFYKFKSPQTLVWFFAAFWCTSVYMLCERLLEL